jgi:adenylate cyclase
MGSLKVRILLGSLLLGLLMGLGSLTKTGYRVEAFALDSWFSLRFALLGPAEIDPSIVLVGVDEPTIETFGKPTLLLQAELAGLIAKIKEGDPAAVGLDLIISPYVANLEVEDPLNLRLQEEAFELGMQVLDDENPVVLAESYSDDLVSQNQTGKLNIVSPHEAILDLLADEKGNTPNLAFVNQPTDPDGLIRRSKLYYHVDSEGKKTPSNFALRLLEFATGEKLKYAAGEDQPVLTWKDRRVPFLFQESFLINFPGPTEDPGQEGVTLTFPIVSGAKVVSQEIPPEYFKDKIVIIAPTAASLHDEKVVPGDPQYHGGAVHATVLNMFLTDSFIKRSQLTWIVMTVLISWFGWAIGRRGFVVYGTLGAAFVLLFPFIAFTWLGQWLPTIFPFMAYSAASFLGYLERLLTIERDRRRVKSTFARMVSPQVMNHVLDNYRTLKSGQRKEITVLFSDINDFTPTCEQHSPEEVIQMLSEYFSLMVDVIMKYDGYLKQYVGDEIMVIYGAPDDSKDHATRAVLTALEMRDVLAKARETSEGKPGFYDVKIGLNTGSVVVGKVGPESRWEYAAVGDDVNLGARVMSVAKKLGMDIGISEATRQRFVKERETITSPFNDKVKWISQGVQSFKGKISQMEVFGIERE